MNKLTSEERENKLIEIEKRRIDKKVLEYLERAKVIASKSVLNNIESDDLYEARIIEIAKLIQLEETKWQINLY